jgi:hypothetical protein
MARMKITKVQFLRLKDLLAEASLLKDALEDEANDINIRMAAIRFEIETSRRSKCHAPMEIRGNLTDLFDADLSQVVTISSWYRGSDWIDEVPSEYIGNPDWEGKYRQRLLDNYAARDADAEASRQMLADAAEKSRQEKLRELLAEAKEKGWEINV